MCPGRLFQSGSCRSRTLQQGSVCQLLTWEVIPGNTDAGTGTCDGERRQTTNGVLSAGNLGRQLQLPPLETLGDSESLCCGHQLPASEVSRIFVTKSPLAIGGGQLLQGSPVSSLGRAEVSAEGIHHGQLCSGSLP